MGHMPDIQKISIYFLDVLEMVIPEPDSERGLSTLDGPLDAAHISRWLTRKNDPKATYSKPTEMTGIYCKRTFMAVRMAGKLSRTFSRLTKVLEMNSGLPFLRQSIAGSPRHAMCIAMNNAPAS